MKCSPQITLYVSSCFMQSLCAALVLNCSLIQTGFWRKPKKHKNNFHSAFSQCFNFLKSLDIFFCFVSLFLFLLHRHSWNFYTSSVERKHPRKPTVTIKTNTIAQVHFHRGEGKGVGEGLYSEG